MNGLENMKLTIVSNNDRYPITTVFCTCGHHSNKYDYRGGVPICPSCGNSRLIYVRNVPTNRRYLTDTVFETVKSDRKGFHIRKQEYRLKITDDNKIEYTGKGDLFEIIFDNIKKEFSVSKNGTPLVPNETNVERALKNPFDTHHIIPYISNEHNRGYYQFILNKYGAIGMEYTKKWYRAIMRASQYPALEILHNCGFNLHAVGRNSYWITSKETRPHKIFGVPKYLVPFLKEMGGVSSYEVNLLNHLDQVLNGNNLKTALTILKEESDVYEIVNIGSDIITLYREYGYKDIKRLFLYLCREVKLQQGITSPREAVVLLVDYLKMATALEHSIEKYPTSLKKRHDIALMNYRANKDEIKAKAFKEVVSSDVYTKYEYQGDKYSIIAPKESSEIMEEGNALSHCVASYLDDVIKEKCKIFFMRKNEEPDKPLVTIEIRDSTIRQARGEFNRKPTEEENSFIGQWAKEKGLIESLY